MAENTARLRVTVGHELVLNADAQACDPYGTLPPETIVVYHDCYQQTYAEWLDGVNKRLAQAMANGELDD